MTIYPQRSEITVSALHFNKVVFLRVLCYKFHRSLSLLDMSFKQVAKVNTRLKKNIQNVSDSTKMAP